MRSLLASTLALACASSACTHDEPDLIPDHWPGEDLAPCTTTREAYRIDELRLPLTGEGALALGWDLDFDLEIDNHGGFLLSTLADVFAADLAAEVNATLAADLVHVVLTIDTCPDTGGALVSLHRGTSIDRAASPPRVTAIDVTSYAMVAREMPGAAIHGSAQFPVGALVHPDETTWIDGPRFIAAIDTIEPDGEIRGRLAAAFTGTQLYDVVTRAVQRVIADRIVAHPECMDGECEDANLLTLVGIFDDDGDWRVTLDEVRAAGIVGALLAPDIDGDGPAWSTPDGVDDQFSIGVGFRATPVTLRALSAGAAD